MRLLAHELLDAGAHLLMLARLRLDDWMAGPPPETPTDQAIREEGERLRNGSPKSISTIRRQGGAHRDEAQACAMSHPIPVQTEGTRVRRSVGKPRSRRMVSRPTMRALRRDGPVCPPIYRAGTGPSAFLSRTTWRKSVA